MRHRKAGRKFGRTSDQRIALTRTQIGALLRHGRITTTEAKAKELRRWVERVITDAKPADVHAHRRVANMVQDREARTRLFGTYVERFRNRPGGYTRIYRLGPRHGDGAAMAIIELVADDPVTTPPPAPASPRRRRGAS
ncbi:MAG: 50S ribosomal protein L17 [Candidatus Dormibacteria bacterium]